MPARREQAIMARWIAMVSSPRVEVVVARQVQ
jgi:hypothetical protein